ncbi:uncharacterized protein [Cardiocondyla obscurior]|uniref:uncharacterized protein n=1 Tax=Cardiocondyla obscurior TaxID=286306 RepID=UPI003965606A
MQNLWCLQVGWDGALPPDVLARWQLMYSQFRCLNDVNISRWIHTSLDTRVELYGFADASTLAYAAVVYARLVNSRGEIVVSFLAEKSRVALLKPLTVPRLELSAALLLSRLLVFVRDTFTIAPSFLICWSDLTIALTWLRSHPSRWTTFVANRVDQIQELIPDASWRYILTEDNPADCASRGLTGEALLKHFLWWRGPTWLASKSSEWPSDDGIPSVDPLEERKIISVHTSCVSPPWDLAVRYFLWSKLIRITSYILKFVTACRAQGNSCSGLQSCKLVISSLEFHNARDFWLRQIQSELFTADIHALDRGQSVASSSPLAALAPFLDSDKILRVGGRLRHAPVLYNVRHPILLAPHSLVRLLIIHTHLRMLHSGL